MARALPQYANRLVLRDAPGIRAQTHGALVRHGLVVEAETKKRAKADDGSWVAKGTLIWRPSLLGARVLRTEEPRLLAAASDALYTSDPSEALADDAGQAVSEAEQQRFSDQAGIADNLRRGKADEQLLSERADLGRRLLNAKALARERNVDIRDQLRVIGRADGNVKVIEKRIAEIEQLILSQQPTALDRAA